LIDKKRAVPLEQPAFFVNKPVVVAIKENGYFVSGVAAFWLKMRWFEFEIPDQSPLTLNDAGLKNTVASP
jgi:hypothetical protein